MLRDVVKNLIAGSSDVAVVGESSAAEQLTPARIGRDVDVVVTAVDAAAGATGHEELLRSLPHVKVFAIDRRGSGVSLYELAPRRRDLGELSPTALLAAIRRARLSTAAKDE